MRRAAGHSRGRPLPARSGERRHAVRDRRPRLGSRRRHEPVRRPGIRRGGLGLPADPRALLPRHRAARRPGQAGSRPARRAAAAVRIASTKPFRVVDARGKMRRLKPGGTTLVAGKLAKLRLPLRYEPGAAPLQLDGEAYRGALVVHRGAGKLHGRQQAPARPLPARRRALGDAATTGTRRRCVRSPSSHARTRSRRSKPGEAFDLYADTRSQVYGGIDAEAAIDEPGDRLDRRPGRDLPRARRDDLLPLDLGREDGLECRGRGRGTPGAVPRLGRRPARLALEASPLGAVPAHAGRGRGGGSASAPVRDLVVTRGPSGRAVEVTIKRRERRAAHARAGLPPRAGPPLDLVLDPRAPSRAGRQAARSRAPVAVTCCAASSAGWAGCGSSGR